MTATARIAVVGAGWWATTAHLPSLMANARADIAGVCDPDADRAYTAATTFQTKAYTDIATMLDEVRPDGVIVATPHSTHHAVAKAALEAGSHVLVEKPLATTAEAAWELVALAAQHGAILSAGHTYQYAAVAPQVRDAVQHRIGELRSVNAEFSSSTQRLFQTTDPAAANLDNPGVAHGTTYSDPRTGGGQAHTQLSHLLGALMWATGSQATSAAALTANHGLAVDLVDAATFALEGGALCVASSTGTTPPGVEHRQHIRFHGTQGMIEWDLLRACAELHLEGGLIERFTNPAQLPAYGKQRVCASFVETVLDATPTPAPGFAAAAAVALIEAILQAADTRSIVDVMQAPPGATP